MFGLPRRATALWFAVVLSGSAAIGASAYLAALDWRLGPSAFLFGIAGGIAETFRIPMPSSRPDNRVLMAVSSAIYVAAVILFPVYWAVLIVAISFALAQIVAHPTGWYKMLYNVGQIGLSATTAGLVWALAGPGAEPSEARSIPFLLLALVAYFLVNTWAISAIVSLAAGLPLRLMWWRTYRRVLPAWFGMLFVGLLIAVLWLAAAWTIALVAIPLAALFYAARNTVRLETQTIEAMFELADILDARDPYTHGHSLRVGELAERLALACGCSDETAHTVFLAGRLHDIGKCAVRNEVLLKPGPLDPDERAHMARHPEVGATMLAHFALFREGARFVRGHHERWDGQGYPDQLREIAIPIGARIIAIVDAYDAMTTTRPYRTALSHAEAIRRLREGRGVQWDPDLVDVFVDMVEARERERPAPALSPVAAPA